ncbi:MAG: hypothetical protein LPK21_05475, partial [Hymenobacteraceae bacterium]|nr:hypothetical protein [Hymenobacteraceae bacterium]MDX5511684.1 hypothetical protein [Hymenobacteraceae bacterium]
MEMKFLATVAAFAFVVSACKEDTVEPQNQSVVIPSEQATEASDLRKAMPTSCKAYYQIDYTGSISMVTDLTENFVVGFQKGTPPAVQQRVLSKFPFFDSVVGRGSEHFSDYAHIKTKTRMSCLEIQQAIWQLENEGVVLYANPYLYYFIPDYNGGAGFVLPDPLMFGEGVIVNLADDAS